MPFSGYLRVVLAGCVLALIGASAFNWSVDPYAIFGSPRVKGFNEKKPYAGDRGRTAKIYQAIRTKPRGLIVGNSRPEMGLNPEDRCWPFAARPVYNIALPGLSEYKQIRYAQHGIAAGDPRLVLMTIDFADFLNRTANRNDPREWPIPSQEQDAHFLVDANGFRRRAFAWEKAQDFIGATLSLDALAHSVATVFDQHEHFVETRTMLGFNPARNIYLPILRSEGIRVLFRQKDQMLAREFAGKRWALYQGQSRWSSQFEGLSRFLKMSAVRGIRTILVINPLHAEYLVILDLAHLWPMQEEWKRRIVEVASRSNTAVWDFSEFDGFTTEAIDSLAARGQGLKWFWEPAHYRERLGDIMLANIFRATCPASEPIQPFGTEINRYNLDAHLRQIRAERDRYTASHRAVVERLSALVRSARP